MWIVLVESRIDSLDKLELLMAVRAATQVSIAAVAMQLGVGRDDVLVMAAELDGLVAIAGEHVVLAANPIGLDELAAAYHTDRVALVQRIAQRSLQRLHDLADHAIGVALVRSREG